MDEKMNEYLDRVSAEIAKACEGFIGRTAVTEASLAAICDSLRQVSCLQESPRVDDDHLQFMVGVRCDEVVPANLYTAMRMTYGAHAPSWSECEGGVWTAPDGTSYEWRNGGTYITVAKPLSEIKITLKVSPPLPEMFIISYGDTCWVLDDGTTGRPIMGAGPFIKYFGSSDEAQGFIDEWIGKGFDDDTAFNIRSTHD